MSDPEAQEDHAERSFTITLPVTIRRCTEEDLPDLEWFGRFTEHRQIIRDAFDRQQQGENIMLIADADGAPVGQLWIDLTRKQEADTGVLWAGRVFPWLRGHGIGARLFAAAEDLLRSRGFSTVELSVEKDNVRARSLYDRMGYRRIGERQDEYHYTTPEGTPVCVSLDLWVLRKELGA